MTHNSSDQRRILLIDENAGRQNLRATILRNHEIEVHTAANIGDAASLWSANAYDLVLLAAPANSDETALFSAQLRERNPRQRIGLLVGPPAYIQEIRGARRKAASVVSPPPIEMDVVEPSGAPQWQAMVQKLVANWYVHQSALIESGKLPSRIARTEAR